MRQLMLALPLWWCIPLSLSAADWPAAYHDNQRTGVTAEELQPPLAQKWVFQSPAPPAKGWAPPVHGYGAIKRKPNACYDDAFRVIAAGNMVWFASSAEDCVYALDAEQGEVKWRFSLGAAPRLAPVFHGNNVYFGGDDGNVYCLEAGTGKVVWRFQAALTEQRMLGYGRFGSVWPVRSSVMIEDGRLYFTAGLFPSEGIFLYVLDPADGNVIKRKQLDRGGYDAPSPQGYMLASADSVWTTSRVAPARWRKSDLSRISFSTPCPKVKDDAYRFYNGGTEARIWNEHCIAYGMCCTLGFDFEKTIKDKYGRETKGDLVFNWFNARCVLFSGAVAYVATDYFVAAIAQDRLADISRTECRAFEDAYKRHDVARYSVALDEYEQRSAQDRGDPLADKLKKTTLKWGKAKWEKWPAVKTRLLEAIKRRCIWYAEVKATEAMILAGTTLFAGDKNELFAFDAKTGEELWEEKPPGVVRALAVARKRLFVSTTDGNIRCYEAGMNEETPVTIRDPRVVQAERVARKTGGAYAALADSILAASKARRGYCLITGGDSALENALLQKSSFKVQTLSEAEAARSFPYAPYLFNLVIDVEGLKTGESGGRIRELVRVTKPCGGTAVIGKGVSPEALTFIKKLNGVCIQKKEFALVRRGLPPGAANWTDQYATPANTSCSEDLLVKPPFGVLWYGGPGPRKRIDRHSTPPNPLCVNGIVYTIGYDLVMAFDAFNGVTYWERELPGATRSHLPDDTSNLVADETGLFIVVDKKRVLHLDPQTGETLKTYTPPQRKGASYNFWSWITKVDHLLLGTRAMVNERRREADRKRSEGIFAIDISKGSVQWQRTGLDIDHNGVAVSDAMLFYADRITTGKQRKEALKNAAACGVPEAQPTFDRRGDPVAPDLRMIVAVDVQTGKTVWRVPFNISDITQADLPALGRQSAVNCMVKNGVLVVHGDGSIGHPHREFLHGEFKRRALYAFDAKNGAFLWGGRKNYRKRPVIAGTTIYAEPFAWELVTGKQVYVDNPLSGRKQPFDFHRGYIGCGHFVASAASLFGSKEGLGCIPVGGRPCFTSFSGMAFGCSLGAVPANGVLVVPEGRSGCTCATPLYTSIGLYPKEAESGWSRFLPAGFGEVHNFPVVKASVNYGAPGIRYDAEGAMWINKCDHRGTGGVVGKWIRDYTGKRSMFYHVNEHLVRISGTERPWIFASGFEGAGALKLKLIDGGQEQARYTVRLFFCELSDCKAGERVFHVSLQGKRMLSAFDVVKDSGSVRKALIKEFNGIVVRGDLEIELEPAESSHIKKAILCAVQALRER